MNWTTLLVIILYICAFLLGLMLGNYNGRASIEDEKPIIQTEECNLNINLDAIESKMLRLNSSNAFRKFFSPDMTIDDATDIYFKLKPATRYVLKYQVEQVCRCE